MVHKEIIQKLMTYACKQHFDKAFNTAKVISANNGKCEVELKIEDRHTNILGTLHGGLSASLVDVVSGYALLTHPKNVEKLYTIPISSVSVDIHMTYLRSAKVGDEILIQANTVKAGKSLAFLEVTILNKLTEEIIVKGTHTKFIL